MDPLCEIRSLPHLSDQVTGLKVGDSCDLRALTLGKSPGSGARRQGGIDFEVDKGTGSGPTAWRACA
jgi:hypothetical protein